eukprot:scaffold13187_cov18-Tisochrysis_lutea.AAC.1
MHDSALAAAEGVHSAQSALVCNWTVREHAELLSKLPENKHLNITLHQALGAACMVPGALDWCIGDEVT